MDIDWQKKIIPFVLFVLVANPETFKLVRSIAGGWVASSYGVPTLPGLLLHALVFVILCHFVWKAVYGNKTSKYYMEGAEVQGCY
jgi:hypothetical protein